jgi:hypothetical protein
VSLVDVAGLTVYSELEQGVTAEQTRLSAVYDPW